MYRNSDGESCVLNVVRKIEHDMDVNPLPNKDYLPITGMPEFVNGALRMMFGANCFEMGNDKVLPILPRFKEYKLSVEQAHYVWHSNFYQDTTE